MSRPAEIRRLFLSYSSKDKVAVRRLNKDLKKAGLDTWFDDDKIGVGDRIPQKIQEGLERSHFICIWLTKESVSSGWVEKEWSSRIGEEIEHRKPIVLPLLAETCVLPPFLRDKRYADFRGGYARGLKELLAVAQGSSTTQIAQASDAPLLRHAARRLLIVSNDTPAVERLRSVTRRPSDTLHTAVVTLVNHVTPIIRSIPPYRRYYLNLMSPKNRRLRSLLAVYALVFYLGSVTRYRPYEYEKIKDSIYGMFVAEFVETQGQQFWYALASEFLRQSVSLPAVLR